MRQIEKSINGVNEPHRPSCLSENEKKAPITHLREVWLSREYPRYEDIEFYIESEFGKMLYNDTLRKIIHMNDVCKVNDADHIEEKRYEVSYEQFNQSFEKLQHILPTINFIFCFNLDETAEDEYTDIKSIKVIIPHDFQEKRAKIPVGRGQKRLTIVHCIFNMFNNQKQLKNKVSHNTYKKRMNLSFAHTKN